MPHTLLTDTIALPGAAISPVPDELRITFAEPEGAVRGGLVVLHDASGVTPAVELLVSALAAEGWLAVVPHLYRQAGELAVEQAPRALSGETVLAEAAAAVDWLAGRGISRDLTGVVGFDLGGVVSFALATRRDVGAAVSVAAGGINEPAASGLPALRDAAGRLRCPWLGLYGDLDDAIAIADVESLREAADAARIATDIVRYPRADHRFDTDPDAAAEAWQRALNWFDAHLR